MNRDIKATGDFLYDRRINAGLVDSPVEHGVFVIRMEVLGGEHHTQRIGFYIRENLADREALIELRNEIDRALEEV